MQYKCIKTFYITIILMSRPLLALLHNIFTLINLKSLFDTSGRINVLHSIVLASLSQEEELDSSQCVQAQIIKAMDWKAMNS